MSKMPEPSILLFVLEQFFPRQECLVLEPIENCHIHLTVAAQIQTPRGTQEVVLQRINRHVFPHP